MNRSLRKTLNMLNLLNPPPEDPSTPGPYVLSPSKARRIVARINGIELTPRRPTKGANLGKSKLVPSPRVQPPEVLQPEEGTPMTRSRKRRRSESESEPTLTDTPKDEEAFWQETPAMSEGSTVRQDGEDGGSVVSEMSICSESTVKGKGKGKGRAVSPDEVTVRGGPHDAEGGEELYRPPPGRAYVGRPPPALQATEQPRQAAKPTKDYSVASSSRDVAMCDRSITPTPTARRMYVGSNVPLKIHDVLTGAVDHDGDEHMRETTPTVFSIEMDGQSMSSVATTESGYVKVPIALVEKHMPWFLK
ncbi:uncharacterized protein PHACADRAFT_183465 [Phanerochaete carnosa HHB-10118-sp]|uniref:Uncharacterized protein n=1 Tax=Phanerochaete carnosa (strain HHB-10118-sp) TaxID=650164 RepID=K5X295_PHACS|nr:uncharacterized protein PHACADRAFT_183465 [Phanerochaete carnosa HHB-10118-sp]EKM56892.1 hypothetical protein PHACADRAFT_183465 [Phanerochaete carnosa HHB-10118-sp]